MNQTAINDELKDDNLAKIGKVAKKKTSKKKPIGEPSYGHEEIEMVCTEILDRILISDREITRRFLSDANPIDVEQQNKIDKIQKAGAAFAQIVRNNTVPTGDSAHAIRQIHSASMFACSAVKDPRV